VSQVLALLMLIFAVAVDIIVRRKKRAEVEKKQ
jgi:hypothetical protein